MYSMCYFQLACITFKYNIYKKKNPIFWIILKSDVIFISKEFLSSL